MANQLYKTMGFDSNEEMYFDWWLKEILDLRLYESIHFHPITYSLSSMTEYPVVRQLKTKVKKETRCLLEKHVYTPDFAIVWHEKAKNYLFRDVEDDSPLGGKIPFFAQRMSDGKYHTMVEIKPDYDMHNMTREFKINQKWVMDKYSVFVQLIKTPSFFKKTFTPNRFLFCNNKSAQPRKIKFNIRARDEFFSLLKKPDNQVVKESQTKLTF